MKSIYLNCEDFKKHSFPNVLIEILVSIFREMDRNITGWFGRKRKSKNIIQDIITKLGELQKSADIFDQQIRQKSVSEGSIGLDAGVEVEALKLGYKQSAKDTDEIERSFNIHREKLQELDRWLPELKDSIRTFFCYQRM